MIRNQDELLKMYRDMPWPENYYKLTDPYIRKQLLEEQLKEHDFIEDKWRLELWKARYELRGKDRGNIDYFVRAWMNLMFEGRDLKSRMAAKRRKRETEKAARDLCLDFAVKNGKESEDVLFRELYHLVTFIINTNASDKKYSSVLFGFGTMTDEGINGKIANDINIVTKKLPEEVGMEQEFNILNKAAKAAFQGGYI